MLGGTFRSDRANGNVANDPLQASMLKQVVSCNDFLSSRCLYQANLLCI
jgi:hypothetical protein